MLFAYLKNKWNEWKANKERIRKEAEEAKTLTLWRVYHEATTIHDVSTMTGIQFEGFLARLFSRMGYTEIKLTPANDQGGDMLCVSPSGVPLVVQAKRWNGTVGNQAVSELLGAMRYYKRNKGLVVTNSTFTRAAVQLAETDSDITLCDRRWLEEQVRTFLPPEVPEFNRERFDEIVTELCELTREIGSMRTGHYGRRRRGANEDYTFLGILTRFAAAKGKGLTPAEIMDAAQCHAKIAKVEAELHELEENKEGRLAY